MKTHWIFLAPLVLFAGAQSIQAGLIGDFVDSPALATMEDATTQECPLNLQGDPAFVEVEPAWITSNPLSAAAMLNTDEKTERAKINIESGSSGDLSSAGPLTFYANGFSTLDIIGYELTGPWSTAALVASGALIILVALRLRISSPPPPPARALKFNTSSAPVRP